MKDINPGDILTVEELVDLIGWDDQKIWRWVREKRLPLLKRAGNSMLFSRPAIEKWDASHCSEGSRSMANW